MGERKTAVTVVSGFLGSGKTTLLRRLLSDPNLPQKLAVLVNDLGELGLDHEIIASETETPTLRVTELVSGCICCTLRSELGEALSALARGDGLARPPEHILIEPSGIARASEVSFAVNALSFDVPVECDAVVTVIDLHNAERAHREHPDLFEDQVRAADLLILNKIDLVPDRDTQTRLSTWLRSLSPRAQQVFADHAMVDDCCCFIKSESGTSLQTVCPTEPQLCERVDLACPPEGDCEDVNDEAFVDCALMALKGQTAGEVVVHILIDDDTQRDIFYHIVGDGTVFRIDTNSFDFMGTVDTGRFTLQSPDVFDACLMGSLAEKADCLIEAVIGASEEICVPQFGFDDV